MKRIRRWVALSIFVAAAALGAIALTSPAEAGGPKCIIKCVEGVCERCCHERGGWVCT